MAIDRVREEVTAAFGARGQFTPIAGLRTLVDAEPEADADQFDTLTRMAVAAALVSRVVSVELHR